MRSENVKFINKNLLQTILSDALKNDLCFLPSFVLGFLLLQGNRLILIDVMFSLDGLMVKQCLILHLQSLLLMMVQ